MFLAPLNYDRYFSKVFSDEKISKSFLEDFLEASIDEFEILKSKHRVTDNASLVEFDFRCRINDSVVILDMQQWYKRDVVRRFYLYHALSTGLQLEKLPRKRIIYDYSYQKTKKAADYQGLQPVLTLVWMVDDVLGCSDDYAAYTMTPELVMHFIKNEKLWHKPEIIEILTERARVLELLDNQGKELDFLLKNRLVFMLQKNIVKNKTNTKYRKWFDFAQKTKNPDNTEADFQEYMDHEIFREIIKRINKKELSEDDFQYIDDETKIREEVERFESQIYEDGREEGMEKGKKDNALEVAVKLKAKGFDDDIIAEVTGLSPDEIARLNP